MCAWYGAYSHDIVCYLYLTEPYAEATGVETITVTPNQSTATSKLSPIGDSFDVAVDWKKQLVYYTFTVRRLGNISCN